MNEIFKLGKLNYIVGVILFSLPGIVALLHPGLHPTHDGEYHIIRFHEFYKTFSSGDFYPRWASGLNSGFGVPLFNYVYPFPNYFAAFLHIFGVSFIDGFKLNLFFASIIGSILFFLWTREYWGSWGGLVSAISYSYAPYKFVDIYIRGSVGEIWALAFFPGYMWMTTKLSGNLNFNYSIFAGTFYALTIYSHNILAVMLSIFGLTYNLLLFFIGGKQIKFLIYSAISWIIGLGLSAIFWIPALFEKNLVRGLEIYNPSEHFVEIYELLIPSWGSGFSMTALENRMSFQIGIVPIISVLFSIVLITFNKNIKNRKVVYFFYFCFFVSCCLMLSISKTIWNNLIFINYFQFPWRILSITIICTSFISGLIITFFRNLKTKVIFTGIVVLINMIFTIKYTKPAYYHNRTDSHYLSRKNFTEGTNSPGNLFNTIWFNDPGSMYEKLQFINAKGSISELEEKPTYKKYLINSKTGGETKAKIAYFPGWSVWQDGERKVISISKQGFIEFNTDSGKRIIEIKFLDTIIRKISIFVTICTFVALTIVLYMKKFIKV